MNALKRSGWRRRCHIMLACLIAGGCTDPADPDEVSATDQELVTLPGIVVGNTAYNLGYEDPAGKTYRQVIDWNVAQGVNLLRIDAPATLTSSAVTRLTSLIAYAKSKGVAIALGTGVLADKATTARADFVHTLATSLCTETHVFLERDWETAYDAGISISSFDAATNQLRAAFGSGCVVPSIAVHVKRNNNYGGTASGYHGTNAGKESFTTQSAINMRGLHEAGKLEGYGVSEPGPAHPLVMETLYEDNDGSLAGGNVDATLWKNQGVFDDLQNDAAYYFRWYTAGVLLSGGRGLVYGMAGASPHGGQRYAWGLPDGGEDAGLGAIVRVTHFLQGRGFSPLTAVASDALVDNGFAGGLKRAKAATLSGTVYIYDPLATSLKITGQKGKVIELYNPATGADTSGIATITTDPYTFHPPSGVGDYLLVIRPASGFSAKINFEAVGAAVPSGYAADEGRVYAARSGLTYGWNTDHSELCRDRNLTSDQRLDTLCHFRNAASRWELAVPNGTYSVTVSVGDAGFTSNNTLIVEGVTYWSHLALGVDRFANLTKQVVVSDGRLTISNGTNVFPSTKINYVEVASSAP